MSFVAKCEIKPNFLTIVSNTEAFIHTRPRFIEYVHVLVHVISMQDDFVSAHTTAEHALDIPTALRICSFGAT